MQAIANRIFPWANARQKLPVLLLALCLLILGLYIYRDYGVGWDEVAQRRIGVANYDMVSTGDESVIANFKDKDHGAAFELPLLWIEKLIAPASFREMIFIRHLCGYLFYAVGLCCGYLLALHLFRRQWIAFLGVAMLLLQPRIFAHAFFNSKDVPFLTAMLIALFAISTAFEGRRLYLFALAGIACGYAAGIRMMGLLPVLLVGFLLLSEMIGARRSGWRPVLWQLLVLCVSTCVALYASWPALWHHPLQSLADTLMLQSRYTIWSGQLLLNGTIYPSAELPWYYMPEWFFITTPICWMIAGFAGLVLGCYMVVKNAIPIIE